MAHLRVQARGRPALRISEDRFKVQGKGFVHPVLGMAGAPAWAVFLPALLRRVLLFPAQTAAQRGGEEQRELLTRDDAALLHSVVLGEGCLGSRHLVLPLYRSEHSSNLHPV